MTKESKKKGIFPAYFDSFYFKNYFYMPIRHAGIPKLKTRRNGKMAVKYVFVTGGVVSGLGKGITAASLGRLLKARGYQVTMQKFDP